MKNTQQLDKVALINELREKDASRNLADDNARHEELQLQLARLTAYRDEYQQKLSTQLSSMESANAIRDYHNFIRVLDHAIKDQEMAINDCANQLRTSKDRWIHSKSEVKKIENIKDKVEQQNRLELSRLEQKQSDEMSLSRFNHK